MKTLARTVSRGTCQFCDAEIAKTAIAKHLSACPERPAGADVRVHLVAEAHKAPHFWLHLDVAKDATLDDLDSFLRAVWVECCGHLSAFFIQGREYEACPDAGNGGMGVSIGKALKGCTKFRYIYDFGSSTEIELRVLGDSRGPADEADVRLLAQNLLPAYSCACGKAATQICQDCMWSGDPLYCDECLPEHDCGEDSALPLVNSPRAGICGYGG